MATSHQMSSEYIGLKIQRKQDASTTRTQQVRFMPPMLIPKLKSRVRKPINVKQRRTELNFFLPSLSNRDKAKVIRDTSPWKLAEPPGRGPGFGRNDAVHASLDRARYGAAPDQNVSASQDWDYAWEAPSTKRTDATVDRRIVHHLRRKLNRRLERRINRMMEEEMDKDKLDTDRAQSRRSNTGAKTPFDPINSYTEFGEKLSFKKTARDEGDDTANQDLSRKTPLPEIPRSPRKQPKPITQGPQHDQPQAQGADEILEETRQGAAGKTFALTGFARDGTIVEDPIEGGGAEGGDDLGVVSRPQAPVSPVPTPLIHRPETRQQTRVSIQVQRDRLLEGDLTVHVKPRPKTLKVFLQSCFADTELERTQLIETVYTKLRSFARERGFDLHIIDPHWAHDNLTAAAQNEVYFIQKVIDRCRENRQGINFMVFLGQKLGPVLLPPTIAVQEFERICSAAEAENARQVALARERAAAYEETRRQREAERLRQMAENPTPETETPVASPDKSPDPRAKEGTGEGHGSAGNESPAKGGGDTLQARKEGSFLRTGVQEAVVTTGDMKVELLRTWYKLDENAKPPVYELQRISDHLKDIVSTDAKRREKAHQDWAEVTEKLQYTLQSLSKQLFTDPVVLKKFNTTLTEIELDRGLDGELDDVTSHCVWFYRTIDDINLGVGDERLKDFQDIAPHSVAPIQEHQYTLQHWRQNVLGQVVPEEYTRHYRINWHSKGVTMTIRDHVNYVDRLCKDFCDVISRNVDQLSQEHEVTSHVHDDVYQEVEQHVHHTKKRARMFQGRKDLLQSIKRYVRADTGYPLVVHGKPGCGRTALMAKAAKDVHKWFKGSQCVTIVRIIGVTAHSTNIRVLLRYLCLQLCHVFGDNTQDVPHDYKGLLNDFGFRLTKADERRQLVIFLDSLHLLADENEGRNLAWLPTELPPFVRLLVSTLPDDIYPCYKALNRLIPDAEKPNCFLEIKELPIADAAAVLDHWFQKASRTITKEQREFLVQNYRACPQPLYLKVLFNEALSWPSHMPASQIRVSSTVKNLATVIMGRMERDHGEILVRRALGYISASRSGLTETEMEDLLSLDDAVMADVMVHVKPAIRRLPTLLWLRLREDLGEYIEDTNADGCVTLKWSNIQFFQAAEERYLSSRDRAPSYHKAMTEYFMDMWTDTPKPYQGNEKGHLRYIVSQPLYREVTTREGSKRIYNLRRLNELPYHFLNSQQMDALKTHCLCNFEFILAKISGLSLRALFEDFQMALTVEPADADLKLLSDTLHLSLDALAKDPRQLASQIIGRLHTIITKDVPVSHSDPVKYPFLKPFFNQAQEGSVPALIPSITCLTPPGGVLYDLLSGHTEPITAVCMSRDGQKCVTTSKDNTLKMWLLKTGRVVKTIVGVGLNVIQIQVGGNNAVAITSELSCIRFWSLRSGDCLKVIEEYQDPATIITASEGLLLAAFFHGTNIMRVWSLGGKFSLQQEVFLDEDETSSEAIHQDNSTIVASNSHGPLVLHAYKNSNEAIARNAKNGNVVHTLKVKESGCITAMACSPEYFVIATRYQYMQLHELVSLELFDNRNGAYIREVRGCIEDIVSELYVNHMGSHAVAICHSEANKSSEIALWNIETQEHKHIAKHPQVSKRGACIDLRYCLTAADGENTLRNWNLSGMVNQPGSKARVKDGLEQIIRMTDNSRYVIAKSMNNGPLSVWNIAKGQCAGNAVHIERGLVNATDVMLVRNTKTLILTDKGFSSVSEDRPPVYQTLLVYDLLKKKYIQKLHGVFITPSPPHEYVFLDDDHLMGLADNRSHLVVWSTVTGHVVNRIKANFKEFERRTRELGIVDMDEVRHRNNATSMMTPWDRRTETKSAKQRRRQAEIEEEKMRLDDLKRERDNVIQQYMISKDLSTVVTSHYAHHLCVYDVVSQTHIQTLENYNSMMFLHTAALSPKGNYLVHTNYDDAEKVSYVTLWDCKKGHVRKRLKNEKNVCCIDICDNAHRVVFGKSNRELRIWEPGRGSTLKRVKGYATLNFGVHSEIHMVEGGSKAIIFAGDISIWDLVNCRVLGVFTPDTRIQSFTLAMEGKLIVFGLQDTSDVVTLRLMSKDNQIIRKLGKDLFGEKESSDEEDAELEAQLEQF